MNQEANIAKRDQAGALSTNLFEADANAGSQNISQEDLALPFLKVLGQLSPEVNKKDSKYVAGAEPGKIYNTVTTEIYDQIDVLPVFYKRQYVEWQDRGTSMGAPVAIHDVNSGIINDTTRDKMNKDRLLKDLDPYSNPRNTASGSLKLLDSRETSKRPLDCFFYSLLGEKLPYNNHYDNLKAIKEWGFKVSRFT